MDEESFSSKTWKIDFLKKEKLFKPGLQGLFLYIQFPPWCKDKDYIGLWIMDYGLWIMGYGLWIMDYGLWIIDCGL